MGYREARAQVVTIVDAIAPYESSTDEWMMGRAQAYRLKHFPDASDDKLPKPRGYYMRAISHAMRGPYTPGLPQRHHSEMLLTVAYRSSSDPSSDDATMAYDHRKIATALLDASNWARSTSTIISIHAADDLLMPATIDTVEGAKLLRVTFSMEYTSS